MLTVVEMRSGDLVADRCAGRFCIDDAHGISFKSAC